MEMRLRDRAVISMTCRMIPFYVTCMVLFSISSKGSEPANCPDSVDVKQELIAPVSGWTTMIDDTPHRLANVTFYDGPPQQRASLIYDEKSGSQERKLRRGTFVREQIGRYWQSRHLLTRVLLLPHLPSGEILP